MNDYRGWKNIQYPLLPETILIPSIVPAIGLEIDYRDKETFVCDLETSQALYILYKA